MLSQIRAVQIAARAAICRRHQAPAHFEGEIMKGHVCHKYGGSSRGEGPETSMKYLNPESFKVDSHAARPMSSDLVCNSFYFHLHRFVVGVGGMSQILQYIAIYLFWKFNLKMYTFNSVYVDFCLFC